MTRARGPEDWRRPTRRQDELRGFWPGLRLALGLGLVAGTVTATVFVGWLSLTQAAGIIGTDSGNAVEVAGWWVLLWLALSAGLIAGLGLGYRLWGSAYPRAQRIEAARERRAAVREVEALLDDARTVREER